MLVDMAKYGKPMKSKYVTDAMADEFDIVFDRESLLHTASHDIKKSHNFLMTFCLCAAFFTLGVCIAMPGPTLIDLQENTQSNASQIASIFAGRSAGYLLGSIFGGCLFDRINQSLLLALTLLLTAVMTAVVPLSHSLAELIVLILFQGLSMGFLDTGGNVTLLHIWARDSAPYMQALHFSFGLGAFLAPLIAETLLMQPIVNINNTNNNRTLVDNSSSFNNVYSRLPLVMYSYVIVSILLAVVGIMFLAIWCRIDNCVRHPCSMETTIKSDYTVREERRCFRVEMLLLLFVFYFLYVGMEVTYGALIVEFAVERLHWNKVRATWLNSVFWGAFALARGLAIPAAHCLTPSTLLITDLVLTTVALTGLVAGDSVPQHILIYNISVYELVVWLCTALLGIGFSSIFPAGISWAERYMRITGKATSVFVIGSALGEMVLPAVTGFLVASQNVMWLMYIELIATVVSVVLFVIMWNLACSVGERYELLSASDDSKPLHTAHVDIDDDDDDDINVDIHSHSKKHVTFDLVSGTSPQSRATTATKISILKTKSMAKTD